MKEKQEEEAALGDVKAVFVEKHIFITTHL